MRDLDAVSDAAQTASASQHNGRRPQVLDGSSRSRLSCEPPDPKCSNATGQPRGSRNGHTSALGSALVNAATESLDVQSFGLTFFNNLEDSTPKIEAEPRDWLGVVKMLTTFDVRQERDGRLWAPATFSKRRRLDKNVVELSLLVLDFDNGLTLAQVLEVCAGFDAVVHTTFRHRENAERLRAVIRLARPVPAADWRRFWHAAVARFGSNAADPKAKNEARVYYTPACSPEHKHLAQSQVLEGDALDPHKLLAASTPEPEQPQRAPDPRASKIKGTSPLSSRREKYLRAALENQCGRVIGAVNGNRNSTLNNAALSLGHLVQPGGLSRGEVEDALRRAAGAHMGGEDGLSTQEVEATIRSGLEAGMREPRDLGELDRHRSQVLAEQALKGDRRARSFDRDFPPLEASDIPKPILTDGNGKPEYAARQIVELLHPTWQATALTTHAAHAKRITTHYGSRLVHNSGLGWCFNSGPQWKRDDKKARGTLGLVASLSAAVRAEGGQLLKLAGVLAAAGRGDDCDALTRAAKHTLKHAAQVEATGFISDALEQAASAQTVDASIFDQKPFLLGFQNGTWAHGEWREHRREDYLLHLSPVHVDWDADRWEWEQVLERMTGGDAKYKVTLQDIVGYILSGTSHSRLLPWAYGPRGTGKSTIAELMQSLLGPMATAIDSKYLEDNSPRERLGAVIWNQRLAVCAESGKKRLDAEILKMLSGGDTLPVRLLFCEAFDARPRHVLMMVSNDPPRVEAHDDALRERVICLPFEHSLSQPEPLQITGGPRIEAARSDPTSPLVRGFTTWAIEGLERFHKHQEIYRAPVVEAACAKFWADADPITPFWETVENADFRHANNGNGIPKPELRGRYETFCESEGIRPVGRDRFSKACQSHGLEEHRSNGIRYWRSGDVRGVL